MGGAFGAKLETKVELLAVAAHLLLRKSTDRPVVLLYDREDVFYTVQKHEARVAIESAIKGGMIVGRRIELVYNGGAFPKPTPARSGMLRALGPYRIDNLHIDSFMCRSNTVPAGAMRGSMTTQVAFAYESEMDKIAAHLGISPFEIRERHLIRSGDTYLTGAPITDLHFDRILGRLKETVDAWKEEPVELRPWERRGTGIGLMIKSTATPSVSEAELTFYSSGHCELRAASVEFGQGIVETLVQIVAETLRISKDRIDYAEASTGLGLFDSLTASSRSAASMGTAVLRAAQDLRERFARLDSAPDDLIDKLNGDSAVDGSRIANELGMSLRNEGLNELKGMGVYSSTGGADLLDPDTSQGPNPSVHWHQGGAAVELIVDVGTGKVRMERGFGVSYAGRVLNSGAVTGQNEGSFIYGLGQSLFERLEYADGHLTNASLAEYLVPGFADIPGRLHTDALESSGTSVEPHGVGEMVVPAVGPAIANAITVAIGARPHSLPCTSENVLNLIRGECHE
jgi:CO/xanthine dehydrogenase Mo-binding subunit